MQLEKGKVLDIGKLTTESAGGELGDLDKVLKLLDKVDKLLGNPLVQQVLGIKAQQSQGYPHEPPSVPMPEASVMPNTIVARSEVHRRIFETLNKLDENQIIGMLEKYGGQIDGAQEIAKFLKG